MDIEASFEDFVVIHMYTKPDLLRVVDARDFFYKNMLRGSFEKLTNFSAKGFF